MNRNGIEKPSWAPSAVCLLFAAAAIAEPDLPGPNVAWALLVPTLALSAIQLARDVRRTVFLGVQLVASGACAALGVVSVGGQAHASPLIVFGPLAFLHAATWLGVRWSERAHGMKYPILHSTADRPDAK